MHKTKWTNQNEFSSFQIQNNDLRCGIHFCKCCAIHFWQKRCIVLPASNEMMRDVRWNLIVKTWWQKSAIKSFNLKKNGHCFTYVKGMHMRPSRFLALKAFVISWIFCSTYHKLIWIYFVMFMLKRDWFGNWIYLGIFFGIL